MVDYIYACLDQSIEDLATTTDIELIEGKLTDLRQKYFELISQGEIVTAKFRYRDSKGCFSGDETIVVGPVTCFYSEIYGLSTDFGVELPPDCVKATHYGMYRITIVPEDKMPLTKLAASESHAPRFSSELELLSWVDSKEAFKRDYEDIPAFFQSLGEYGDSLIELSLYQGKDLLIKGGIKIFPTTIIDEGGLEELIIRLCIERDGTKDL
ncbi:hypothetical protein HOH11_02185 [Candidatus Woesearchaeota archaeon]|jgi:hypothetical protein|nr:hypothetical protein [Candidatus Woesearchaeota archaeon]MBT5274667.1 hypothetical protein [Candidatus Woesearchaeota archaeon]MBT6023384.1 hypothetical protein [Candidatus Woesearchaeota archaeon]